MRIKIVKIIRDNLIEFSGGAGCGIGFWGNDSLKEGVEYDAELDIDPKIELGVNTKIVPDKLCFIRHNLDTNEIQGMVEGIDEDLLIYFRLARDCIIMIENESTEIKKGDYLLLTINANELRITPFGYPSGYEYL
jgi:hypothetical protein